MKYKDFSAGEKNDIGSLLNTTKEPKERKIEDCGLCGTCKFFHLTKTKFEVIKSKCTLQNFNISVKDPIIFCNTYQKMGEMSLYEMSQIAFFIEIEEEEGKVGF